MEKISIFHINIDNTRLWILRILLNAEFHFLKHDFNREKYHNLSCPHCYDFDSVSLVPKHASVKNNHTPPQF